VIEFIGGFVFGAAAMLVTWALCDLCRQPPVEEPDPADWWKNT